MRVEFLPTDRAVELRHGRKLMGAITAAGLPIARACGGRGVCDSCRVRVEAGSEWLAEIEPGEARFDLPQGWRLACLARIDETNAGPLARVKIWCPSWGADPRE